MSQTKISIKRDRFYINDRLTYSEIAGSEERVRGLLMNARFIQGIFDDKNGTVRYQRFGRVFNSEKNTNDLIRALPRWYAYGLRAITVGLQGGGVCFTIPSHEIDNNPYSEDGLAIDLEYLRRLDRIITAADQIGMVIIVNLFYYGQQKRLKNNIAVVNALKGVCRFIKEKQYTNVIIDVANEHDIKAPDAHSMIYDPACMAYLIHQAKEDAGVPVSCSFMGGSLQKEVVEEADFILLHGNGCSNQQLANLIEKARSICSVKPVIINEDSQDITNMETSINLGASWGYYNNMTKQEPPVDWDITLGEDLFFAERMALCLGIKKQTDLIDLYYLQGAAPQERTAGKMWLRLASLYPETIRYVKFYVDGRLAGMSFDSPFLLYQTSNWSQKPLYCDHFDNIKAEIYMADGTVLTKEWKNG